MSTLPARWLLALAVPLLGGCNFVTGDPSLRGGPDAGTTADARDRTANDASPREGDASPGEGDDADGHTASDASDTAQNDTRRGEDGDSDSDADPDGSRTVDAAGDADHDTGRGDAADLDSDGPPASTCGNGVVESREVCDGDAGRRSCATGVCAHDCRCAPVPTPPAGWAYIPPGTFTMGSPAGEVGYRQSNEAQHAVTLTRGFLLSTTEVTQAQWRSLMGTSPSYVSGCDTCPVERVSWWDAVAYANARSRREGLEECYVTSGCTGTVGGGCSAGTTGCTDDYTCGSISFAGLSCGGYRLPTEAEWEYAARGGTTTATYRGNLQSPYECDPQPNLEPIAWYCGNAGDTTHPVGGKASNARGLYDMLGNVWEWVWDGYDSTLPAATDPTGDDGAAGRVDRGGSWGDPAGYCRAAFRHWYTPASRHRSIGFRLSRSVR